MIFKLFRFYFSHYKCYIADVFVIIALPYGCAMCLVQIVDFAR